MKNLSRLEIFGITCFIITAIVFVGCTGYRMYLDSIRADDISDGANLAEHETIMIHIDGAIENPGVYELPANSRIRSIIDMAGGFAEEANRDLLNLAEILRDGQKVYVPSEGETVSAPLVTQSPTNLRITGESGMHFPINLNTASKEQLMTLPGIGEVRASDIIEYREARGGFKRISDIMDVRGIGEKTYENIKDLVYI